MSADPRTGPAPVPQSPTLLLHTRAELARALSEDTSPRAVVMTMGALHQGHFDLVAEAARLVGSEGTVVVTIFVNPLQFAAGEDLDTYPRTLEADVRGLANTLTDPNGGLRVRRLLVFAPTPDVIYPDGQPGVRIDPGPLSTVLEGATRPTHFAGVCQVVLTLLHLTQPRWALFGRKDAQQLAIVRAMVRDLAVPVEIVPVGIRREDDGLAMSSRNAYLSAQEREQALALSRALAVGDEAARAGASPAQVRQAALDVLGSAPGVELDYVAVVDPDSFVDLAGAGLGLDAPAGGSTGASTRATGTAVVREPAPDDAVAGAAGVAGVVGDGLPGVGLPGDDAVGDGSSGVGSLEVGAVGGVGTRSLALLAVAARIGSTRLIDNAIVALM